MDDKYRVYSLLTIIIIRKIVAKKIALKEFIKFPLKPPFNGL